MTIVMLAITALLSLTILVICFVQSVRADLVLRMVAMGIAAIILMYIIAIMRDLVIVWLTIRQLPIH